MRVKAVFPTEKEFGFYDNRRLYNGQEFNLTDKSHFSEKWMEWITPPVEEKPKLEEKPKRGRPKKVEQVEQVAEEANPFTEVETHGDSHLQES